MNFTMKNNTIRTYQNTETSILQNLLKDYEKELEKCENLKLLRIALDKSNLDIQKTIDDYEIDIHLIRMELNKRLWKNDIKIK